MPRILGLLLLVVVLCVGASVGYFNSQQVEFFYLAGSVKVPLILLVLIVFLSGAALTLLLAMVRIIGLKGEVRRLRRQLHDHEVELKNLRNLPVSAEPPRG
jgi:uncharacterized integral membrane protein